MTATKTAGMIISDEMIAQAPVKDLLDLVVSELVSQIGYRLETEELPKPITLVINGKHVRHGVMDRFDTFPEYDGTFAFRAVFKENDVDNYYFRSGADIRILTEE